MPSSVVTDPKRKVIIVKVLVAVQDRSKDLFDFIEQHKWPDDAQFHVVHVIETVPGAVPGFEMNPDVIEASVEYGHSVAEFARSALARILGPDRQIEVSTPSGSPATAILDIADRWLADVIVTGTHQRGMLGRLFLGSVSLAVVSQAQCSVFIVATGPSKRVKAA